MKNLRNEKTVDELTAELDIFQEHLESFHSEKTITALKGLYGMAMYQLRRKDETVAKVYMEWMAEYNMKNKKYR